MKNKHTFLFVFLFYCISQTTMIFAAGEADITGHWASPLFEKWYSQGVIQPEEGLYRPDEPITRGELADILVAIMKYQDNSYYSRSSLGALEEAGVMMGDGSNNDPDGLVTRQEAVVILSRAFYIEAEARTTFLDRTAIAPWADGYVAAFSRRGMVSGINGNFEPTRTITRAEMLKLIDNAVGLFCPSPGVYAARSSNNVLVNIRSVTLQDGTIQGDVILTEGLEDGGAELSGVTIHGRLIIRGGGDIGIRLKNTTVDTIVVENKENNARIFLDKNSKAIQTMIHSGAELDGEGNYGIVTIDTDEPITTYSDINALTAKQGCDLTVGDGLIDSLRLLESERVHSLDIRPYGTIAKMDIYNRSKLNVDGAISTMTIWEGADSTYVGGDGEVGSAAVSASDVTINTVKTKITIGKEAKNVIGRGHTVKKGNSYTTTEKYRYSWSSYYWDDDDDDDDDDSSSDDSGDEYYIQEIESLKNGQVKVTLSKGVFAGFGIENFIFTDVTTGEKATVSSVKLTSMTEYKVAAAYKDNTQYKLTVSVPEVNLHLEKEFTYKAIPLQLDSASLAWSNDTELEFSFTVDGSGTLYYLLGPSGSDSLEKIKQEGTAVPVYGRKESITIPAPAEGSTHLYYFAEDAAGATTKVFSIALPKKEPLPV